MSSNTSRLEFVLMAALRSVAPVLNAAAQDDDELLANVDAVDAADDPEPPDQQPTSLAGYFSIGQQAVFAGTILDRRSSSLIVERRGPNLIGSVEAIISGFETMQEHDKVVLSTVEGVGYPLVGPPKLVPSTEEPRIELPVGVATTRVKDTKQRVIFAEDRIADLVSGPESVLDAFLAQLHTQEGEWIYDSAFGSRCSEFLRAHSCRGFVEAMLTLEAIRLAFSGAHEARFVSRVHGIELAGEPKGDQWPVRIDIEFEGYPRLQRVVTLAAGEPIAAQQGRLMVRREIRGWKF